MGRLDGKILAVSGGGTDGPPLPGETVAMGNGRAIATVLGNPAQTVAIGNGRAIASRTAYSDGTPRQSSFCCPMTHPT